MIEFKKFYKHKMSTLTSSIQRYFLFSNLAHFLLTFYFSPLDKLLPIFARKCPFMIGKLIVDVFQNLPFLRKELEKNYLHIFKVQVLITPHIAPKIFRQFCRNIPWKYCKFAKIFRNLSLILLKYCNNARTEYDVCNIFQILPKLANA